LLQLAAIIASFAICRGVLGSSLQRDYFTPNSIDFKASKL
jgi:hypothetical protein